MRFRTLNIILCVRDIGNSCKRIGNVYVTFSDSAEGQIGEDVIET